MTTGLADRAEEVVKMAAQELYRKRVEAREAAGPRPFLGKELDPDVSLGEYMRVRHSVNDWAALLQPVVRFTQDGRMLLPKELVESVRKFEEKLAPPPAVSGMGLEEEIV